MTNRNEMIIAASCMGAVALFCVLNPWIIYFLAFAGICLSGYGGVRIKRRLLSEPKLRAVKHYINNRD